MKHRLLSKQHICSEFYAVDVNSHTFGGPSLVKASGWDGGEVGVLELGPHLFWSKMVKVYSEGLGKHLLLT